MIESGFPVIVPAKYLESDVPFVMVLEPRFTSSIHLGMMLEIGQPVSG